MAEFVRSPTLEVDGSFRMVIAHEDPGVDNWLDTEGNPFGMVFWRYFLAEGEVLTPQAEVVKLADIKMFKRAAVLDCYDVPPI